MILQSCCLQDFAYNGHSVCCADQTNAQVLRSDGFLVKSARRAAMPSMAHSALGTSCAIAASAASWKRPVSNPSPLRTFREVWYPLASKAFPFVNQNPSAVS